MAKQTKQDMHDSTIFDNLITLKVILEAMDKFSTVIDLEINNKIKQLEEELRIITRNNRFLRRPSNYIEEEIDLRRQTKKKIDDIEELKEKVKE